jgi:hypothetical protein
MKKVIAPLVSYRNRVQTHTASTTAALPLKKQINVVATTGLTIHLPSAKGRRKEFTVIAVGYNVTVGVAVSTDRICSAASVSATTATVATASSQHATFRAGPSIAGVGMWYRVS